MRKVPVEQLMVLAIEIATGVAGAWVLADALGLPVALGLLLVSLSSHLRGIRVLGSIARLTVDAAERLARRPR